jgi:hypothetical protein
LLEDIMYYFIDQGKDLTQSNEYKSQLQLWILQQNASLVIVIDLYHQTTQSILQDLYSQNIPKRDCDYRPHKQFYQGDKKVLSSYAREPIYDNLFY